MKTTKIIFVAVVLIAWTFLVVLFTGIYIASKSNNSANFFAGGNPQNIANSANLGATTQLSFSEIAKHNSASDCWMVIDGRVYDPTSYIASHPGGQAIVNGCGKDATQLFNTQGGQGSHSQTANEILSSFYIGNLNENISP